jgi:hypothetical protein
VTRSAKLGGVIAAALLAVFAGSGCTDDPGNSRPPWCDNFTVLILAAQSAPTARFIPCLDAMPVGWSVGVTDIDHNRTLFTLNSKIAGDEAARVELRSDCDATGLVQVPSDVVDADRYQYVESIESGYRGRRVYVFEGGCVTIDLDFDVDVSAALVSEVTLALGFVTRAEVNDAVRVITDGREQVDPIAED